jgi:hypothetical protein
MAWSAWWDRSDTEIDLVALDETAQRLRLGSCKRSAAALVADLGRLDGYVARFLSAFPRFSEWQVEKVAIAPSLNQEARQAITPPPGRTLNTPWAYSRKRPRT